MTKNLILKRIAQISSLDYQKRWILNGNKEEYVLLDELLDTTTYAAQHRATHPVLSQNLSIAERKALSQFCDRVNALSEQISWNDPNVSMSQIIESNAAMRGIREAAALCLQAFGLSFTADELNSD